MLKSLKKLKSAISKNIKPKDFFMSDIFRNHFTSIVKMVSHRYNDEAMRVKLGWGGQSVAYTDNRLIYINLNNDLVKQLDKIEPRYLCYLGFLGHELGHVLFTDFTSDEEWLKELKSGKLLCGCLPKYSYEEKDLLSKSKFAYGVFEIYKSLQNCVEDGYVNYAISKEFPGTFKSGIKSLHKTQFSRDVIVSEDHITNLINATLWLTVRGELPKEYEDIYPFLKDVQSEIGDIKDADTMKKRIFITNNILLAYWPYIKKVFENIDQMANSASSQNNNGGQSSDSQGSGSSDNSNDSSQSDENSNKVTQQILKSVKSSQSSSSRGTGKGITCDKNNQEDDDESNKNNGNSSSSKTDNNKEASDNGQSKSEEENDTDSEDDNSLASNEKSENEEEGEISGEDSGSEGEEKNGLNNNDKNQNDSSQDNESDSENDNSSENVSNSNNDTEVPANVTFNGDDSSGMGESPDKVIDRLLSAITEDFAKKQPDEAERMIAQENANNIVEESGSCHFGYPFEIETVHSTYHKDRYNEISKYLLPISKRLQKKILDVLDEKSDGGTCKNLLKGNKINPAAAASSKGRIFKRTNIPESQELAVSVLIDESGSMGGNRIQKAFEMAVIIEDFCRGLNIPVSISGHSDIGHKEVVKDYIRFGDENKNRKYNLSEMRANGCNRDGLALRYCVSNLKQREEDTKLMIIISDGRPNSEGYWGYEAEKDLSDIKKDFERSGGRLIAASIGEDKDTLKRIYQDSFLDITDLNQLPMKMVRLISKFIN